MRKTPETILALDPGLRELGYAVLTGRRLVASGVLNLRELPRPQRLAAACGHVHRWAKAYKPSAIVVEKTYPNPLPWLDGLHSHRNLRDSSRSLGFSKRLGSVATTSPFGPH